jgi:hypothetical protein
MLHINPTPNGFVSTAKYDIYSDMYSQNNNFCKSVTEPEPSEEDSEPFFGKSMPLDAAAVRCP